MEYGIRTAYAVHGDAGNEYGTGPIIAIASTKEKATETARGKGWYGGPGHISNCKVLYITVGEETEYYLLGYDYPLDMDGNIKAKKEARRKELLDNMSDFDKEALGLA